MSARRRLWIVRNPRISWDTGTVVWDGQPSTGDMLRSAGELDNEILGPFVLESVVPTDRQETQAALESCSCQSSPSRDIPAVHVLGSAGSAHITVLGDAHFYCSSEPDASESS